MRRVLGTAFLLGLLLEGVSPLFFGLKDLFNPPEPIKQSTPYIPPNPTYKAYVDPNPPRPPLKPRYIPKPFPDYIVQFASPGGGIGTGGITINAVGGGNLYLPPSSASIYNAPPVESPPNNYVPPTYDTASYYNSVSNPSIYNPPNYASSYSSSNPFSFGSSGYSAGSINNLDLQSFLQSPESLQMQNGQMNLGALSNFLQNAPLDPSANLFSQNPLNTAINPPASSGFGQIAVPSGSLFGQAQLGSGIGVQNVGKDPMLDETREGSISSNGQETKSNSGDTGSSSDGDGTPGSVSDVKIPEDSGTTPATLSLPSEAKDVAEEKSVTSMPNSLVTPDYRLVFAPNRHIHLQNRPVGAQDQDTQSPRSIFTLNGQENNAVKSLYHTSNGNALTLENLAELGPFYTPPTVEPPSPSSVEIQTQTENIPEVRPESPSSTETLSNRPAPSSETDENLEDEQPTERPPRPSNSEPNVEPAANDPALEAPRSPAAAGSSAGDFFSGIPSAMQSFGGVPNLLSSSMNALRNPNSASNSPGQGAGSPFGAPAAAADPGGFGSSPALSGGFGVPQGSFPMAGFPGGFEGQFQPYSPMFFSPFGMTDGINGPMFLAQPEQPLEEIETAIVVEPTNEVNAGEQFSVPIGENMQAENQFLTNFEGNGGMQGGKPFNQFHRPTSNFHQSHFDERPIPHDEMRHRPEPHDEMRHRPEPHDEMRHRPEPHDEMRHRPEPHDQMRHRPEPHDEMRHRPEDGHFRDPEDEMIHRPRPGEENIRFKHPQDARIRRPHPEHENIHFHHPEDENSSHRKPHLHDDHTHLQNHQSEINPRPRPEDEIIHLSEISENPSRPSNDELEKENLRYREYVQNLQNSHQHNYQAHRPYIMNHEFYQSNQNYEQKNIKPDVQENFRIPLNSGHDGKEEYRSPVYPLLFEEVQSVPASNPAVPSSGFNIHPSAEVTGSPAMNFPRIPIYTESPSLVQVQHEEQPVYVQNENTPSIYSQIPTNPHGSSPGIAVVEETLYPPSLHDFYSEIMNQKNPQYISHTQPDSSKYEVIVEQQPQTYAENQIPIHSEAMSVPKAEDHENNVAKTDTSTEIPLKDAPESTRKSSIDLNDFNAPSEGISTTLQPAYDKVKNQDNVYTIYSQRPDYKSDFNPTFIETEGESLLNKPSMTSNEKDSYSSSGATYGVRANASYEYKPVLMVGPFYSTPKIKETYRTEDEYTQKDNIEDESENSYKTNQKAPSPSQPPPYIIPEYENTENTESPRIIYNPPPLINYNPPPQQYDPSQSLPSKTVHIIKSAYPTEDAEETLISSNNQYTHTGSSQSVRQPSDGKSVATYSNPHYSDDSLKINFRKTSHLYPSEQEEEEIESDRGSYGYGPISDYEDQLRAMGGVEDPVNQREWSRVGLDHQDSVADTIGIPPFPLRKPVMVKRPLTFENSFLPSTPIPNSYYPIKEEPEKTAEKLSPYEEEYERKPILLIGPFSSRQTQTKEQAESQNGKVDNEDSPNADGQPKVDQSSDSNSATQSLQVSDGKYNDEGEIKNTQRTNKALVPTKFTKQSLPLPEHTNEHNPDPVKINSGDSEISKNDKIDSDSLKIYDKEYEHYERILLARPVNENGEESTSENHSTSSLSAPFNNMNLNSTSIHNQHHYFQSKEHNHLSGKLSAIDNLRTHSPKNILSYPSIKYSHSNIQSLPVTNSQVHQTIPLPKLRSKSITDNSNETFKQYSSESSNDSSLFYTYNNMSNKSNETMTNRHEKFSPHYQYPYPFSYYMPQRINSASRFQNPQLPLFESLISTKNLESRFQIHKNVPFQQAIHTTHSLQIDSENINSTSLSTTKPNISSVYKEFTIYPSLKTRNPPTVRNGFGQRESPKTSTISPLKDHSSLLQSKATYQHYPTHYVHESFEENQKNTNNDISDSSEIGDKIPNNFKPLTSRQFEETEADILNPKLQTHPLSDKTKFTILENHGYKPIFVAGPFEDEEENNDENSPSSNAKNDSSMYVVMSGQFENDTLVLDNNPHFGSGSPENGYQPILLAGPFYDEQDGGSLYSDYHQLPDASEQSVPQKSIDHEEDEMNSNEPLLAKSQFILPNPVATPIEIESQFQNPDAFPELFQEEMQKYFPEDYYKLKHHNADSFESYSKNLQVNSHLSTPEQDEVSNSKLRPEPTLIKHHSSMTDHDNFNPLLSNGQINENKENLNILENSPSIISSNFYANNENLDSNIFKGPQSDQSNPYTGFNYRAPNMHHLQFEINEFQPFDQDKSEYSLDINSPSSENFKPILMAGPFTENENGMISPEDYDYPTEISKQTETEGKDHQLLSTDESNQTMKPTLFNPSFHSNNFSQEYQKTVTEKNNHSPLLETGSIDKTNLHATDQNLNSYLNNGPVSHKEANEYNPILLAGPFEEDKYEQNPKSESSQPDTNNYSPILLAGPFIETNENEFNSTLNSNIENSQFRNFKSNGYDPILKDGNSNSALPYDSISDPKLFQFQTDDYKPILVTETYQEEKGLNGLITETLSSSNESQQIHTEANKDFSSNSNYRLNSFAKSMELSKSETDKYEPILVAGPFKNEDDISGIPSSATDSLSSDSHSNQFQHNDYNPLLLAGPFEGDEDSLLHQNHDLESFSKMEPSESDINNHESTLLTGLFGDDEKISLAPLNPNPDPEDSQFVNNNNNNYKPILMAGPFEQNGDDVSSNSPNGDSRFPELMVNTQSQNDNYDPILLAGPFDLNINSENSTFSSNHSDQPVKENKNTQLNSNHRIEFHSKEILSSQYHENNTPMLMEQTFDGYQHISQNNNNITENNSNYNPFLMSGTLEKHNTGSLSEENPYFSSNFESLFPEQSQLTPSDNNYDIYNPILLAGPFVENAGGLSNEQIFEANSTDKNDYKPILLAGPFEESNGDSQILSHASSETHETDYSKQDISNIDLISSSQHPLSSPDADIILEQINSEGKINISNPVINQRNLSDISDFSTSRETFLPHFISSQLNNNPTISFEHSSFNNEPTKNENVSLKPLVYSNHYSDVSHKSVQLDSLTKLELSPKLTNTNYEPLLLAGPFGNGQQTNGALSLEPMQPDGPSASSPQPPPPDSPAGEEYNPILLAGPFEQNSANDGSAADGSLNPVMVAGPFDGNAIPHPSVGVYESLIDNEKTAEISENDGTTSYQPKTEANQNDLFTSTAFPTIDLRRLPKAWRTPSPRRRITINSRHRLNIRPTTYHPIGGPFTPGLETHRPDDNAVGDGVTTPASTDKSSDVKESVTEIEANSDLGYISTPDPENGEFGSRIHPISRSKLS